MSNTTPLKPLSENTNPPNSSRSTNSKILSSPNLLKTPKTPLPFSASMSKLSHSSAASSPFFSSPPGRGDRGESPSKMSDFELIGDEDLYAGEVGDDTVSSTFSDVAFGQYGQDAAARGSSVKRSAAKPRPQTPPTKRHQTTSVAATPRTSNTARPIYRGNTPPPPNSPDATPKPHNNHDPNQTSGFLLDFTTQFDAISSRPQDQNQNPLTPSHRRTRSTSPNKQNSPAKFPLPPSTPAESRFFNLLDFSPGPPATPRSIPSITPREVESLKASYQTQISQLKAELSGREVEITGLRDAVRESEDRRADMMHTVKEQEARLEAERDNWRNVRNELGELFEAEKAEKETLRQEFEKREEELRMLRERAEAAVKELAEAKHRVNSAEEEAARARKEAEKAQEVADARPSAPSATGPTSPSTQQDVEKVARELHSLYKAKHESKVAALKKSYENRWEKKMGQLQADLEVERRKNEELQTQITEKGAEDLTGEIGFSPARLATSSPASEELKEELARVKAVLAIVQSELDTERREKGELVGAVEELLAIQAGPGGGQGEQAQVETEKVKKRVARVSGVGLPSGMTGGGFQGGLKSGIARMGGNAGTRDKN